MPQQTAGTLRLSSGSKDGGGGEPPGPAGAATASTVTRRTLQAGAFCGGGAWLPRALHPDTATALTPCVLLSIRADAAKGDPRLRELCVRLATQLGDPWKVELLHHYVPFFSDLPLRSLRELAPLFATASVWRVRSHGGPHPPQSRMHGCL